MHIWINEKKIFLYRPCNIVSTIDPMLVHTHHSIYLGSCPHCTSPLRRLQSQHHQWLVYSVPTLIAQVQVCPSPGSSGFFTLVFWSWNPSFTTFLGTIFCTADGAFSDYVSLTVLSCLISYLVLTTQSHLFVRLHFKLNFPVTIYVPWK
jgi:hypothetical protein